MDSFQDLRLLERNFNLPKIFSFWQTQTFVGIKNKAIVKLARQSSSVIIFGGFDGLKTKSEIFGENLGHWSERHKLLVKGIFLETRG